MRRFEYQTKWWPVANAQHMLNAMGQDGWELVSVVGPYAREDRAMYFFKREASNNTG